MTNRKLAHDNLKSNNSPLFTWLSSSPNTKTYPNTLNYFNRQTQILQDDDYMVADDDVINDNDDKNHKNELLRVEDMECTLKKECDLCSGGSRSGKDGCEETGRREVYDCTPKDNPTDHNLIYLSCRRTVLENQNLVLQFQAIWLLISFIAILIVKKEKRISASLFEQRSMSRQQQQYQSQLQQHQKRSDREGMYSEVSQSENDTVTLELPKADLI